MATASGRAEMLQGYITNVSPGGVLTIWSDDKRRFRFFARAMPNLALLRGIGVEFEPTESGDLSELHVNPARRIDDGLAASTFIRWRSVVIRARDLLSRGSTVSSDREPAAASLPEQP